MKFLLRIGAKAVCLPKAASRHISTTPSVSAFKSKSVEKWYFEAFKDHLRVQSSSQCFELSNEFLLDNDVTQFDRVTHQRLRNVLHMPENVQLTQWNLVEDELIELAWSDGSVTRFDLAYIQSRDTPYVCWEAQTFKSAVVNQSVSLEEIYSADKKGLARFFDHFNRYGVSVVKSVVNDEVS